MPGQGWGGLIANFMNPVDDQAVARSITPNPSPLAQQGQAPIPPVPGAPSNPAPGQAPPQVTQPDPQLLQTNQLLMQGYLNSQRSDAINRGIGQISAGFGTAQQQASKQAALAGMPGNSGAGYLDAIAKMQGIDAQQTAQTEHARAAANMSVLAKALGLPDTPEGTAQATEIWNSGMLPDFGRAAAANTEQTSTVKDYNAAKTALTASIKRDNPNMSDADIAAAVDKRMPPDLLMSSVGGNPEDAAYYQYAALERAAGRTPQDPLAWKEAHQVQATQDITRAKDTTEFKDSAVADYPKVAQKLSQQEEVVDRLLKDPAATMTALRTPPVLTSGPVIGAAQNIPGVGGWIKSALLPSDQTTGLASDIRTLKATLASSALAEFKNVRNRQEFQAIGESLTARLDAANSQEEVMSALQDAKQKLAVARVNASAAAGHELSPEDAQLASPDFLNPTDAKGNKNPYYTGATVAKSPAPTSPTPTVRRRTYNEKGELVGQ